MAASLLHDVGYIYERYEVLREEFPTFYEFTALQRPLFLLSLLDPLADLYGELVKENTRLLLGGGGSSKHGEVSPGEAMRHRFLYAIAKALVDGQGSHGIVSAYVTLKLLLYENPYAIRAYWP